MQNTSSPPQPKKPTKKKKTKKHNKTWKRISAQVEEQYMEVKIYENMHSKPWWIHILKTILMGYLTDTDAALYKKTASTAKFIHARRA